MSFNTNSLYFEKYTDDELMNILRDLSIGESLNIKNLFKSYQTNELNNKKNKSSKIETMIEENKINKQKELETRDKERLSYYDKLDIISSNILDELKYFTTKYGKDRMKMKLLKIAYDKDDTKLITNLYLQLLSDKYDNPKEDKLMLKVKKIMDSVYIKHIQFESLSNELYPLDFYNDYKK